MYLTLNDIKNLLVIVILTMFSLDVSGQDSKSKEKIYQNTVRYNISNPVIFGIENFILGYERTLGKNRSFSIDLGINRLPGFEPETDNFENSTLSLLAGGKNKGLHISADYRFYLKTENKYDAPRGVYIGPYYSFNSFDRTKNWLLTSNNFNGEVGTDLDLKIHTVGAELGYQFQVSQRFMLDFVLFGPGLGIYRANVDFDSSLSPEDSAILLEKINDLLSEKIPGFNTIVDGSGFEKTGVANITGLGYRFMINIGYRF
ncbi:DUF3575 domain-containing protein [Aquiflexum sp. LQ15W]|uniref:DUF3575 domain-containing protein n=1 Tax=Cognataquiflexum nitidum TaxID=2922272 RepID=UPI001F12B7A8|nr:DUF3575 domain-containing protein [Cognataquiflexum nitidum]MCH6199990.1 DUF3575 domain-containing protein [Cognataquiflexum nitidum]